MNQFNLFAIQALSPIHCGIGQGVGDIDLPTARESVTGFPYIPGSSIKGVYKDYWRNKNENSDRFTLAFGKEPQATPEKEYASALSFSDARILLLPVRSYQGTFAYVTCPFVLRRFQKDLNLTGEKTELLVPEISGTTVQIEADSVLAWNGKVLLEDLDLTVVTAETQNTDTMASGLEFVFEQDWQPVFKHRLAVVCDDIFSFLCETALPVIARINIDQDTGIVRDGQLWYEESIPLEALLTGYTALQLLGHGKAHAEFKSFVTGNHFLQIGGNATVGQGLAELRFLRGEVK